MANEVDLLKELARPFPANEIKFKPQAVSRDKTKAQASFYVDARAVRERLDAVFPLSWNDSYRTVRDDSKKMAVECTITIVIGGRTISRSDVGEGTGGEGESGSTASREKTAYSDAFKRAAVKFGVGAHLYAMPKVWAEFDAQYKRFTDKGKAYLAQVVNKSLAEQEKILGAATPPTVPASYEDNDEAEDPGPAPESPRKTNQPQPATRADESENTLAGNKEPITGGQRAALLKLAKGIAGIPDDDDEDSRVMRHMLWGLATGKDGEMVKTGELTQEQAGDIIVKKLPQLKANFEKAKIPPQERYAVLAAAFESGVNPFTDDLAALKEGYGS
jgi:hypothetical protein